MRKTGMKNNESEPKVAGSKSRQKTVNLEKLATALPMPILFESRRRKIQRFLKGCIPVFI
jgi:hypothetical protein